jgi:hypothetical protein
VLVKALIIVDCEPAPPQLSQVGWHVTSADTCCHNMSQSADISSKHGHGMTWPLPSILYRAPPEDPGRSGRTNSWMHPWFHPWTHHRTYLNLLEPTWTHLNLHCLHLQHLQLHCVWDLSTNRFIVCDHTPCRSAVQSILDLFRLHF